MNPKVKSLCYSFIFSISYLLIIETIQSVLILKYLSTSTVSIVPSIIILFLVNLITYSLVLWMLLRIVVSKYKVSKNFVCFSLLFFIIVEALFVNIVFLAVSGSISFKSFVDGMRSFVITVPLIVTILLVFKGKCRTRKNL